MAQDNLERFVIKNRDAFDEDVPSLKVWANIERQMVKERTNRFSIIKVSKIAAAIVFLLSVGATMGVYMTKSNPTSGISQLASIDPELMEMEQFYQEQIQEKMTVLVDYEQQESIKDDFAQLDSTMEELKDELRLAPEGMEEEIIENLIKTYQTKIFILERVLSRLNTTNHKKDFSHEQEVSI